MLVMVIYCDNIMMLNLIKVKFLRGGGEVRDFGGEASPLGPPPPQLDETLLANSSTSSLKRLGFPPYLPISLSLSGNLQ